MHILIISDAYPPMRTSCATQIYDLAQAFLEQRHQVSIIIPSHSQKNIVEISNAGGPTVYSVRCFKTKDVGYARRTIAEFINPFIIGYHLKRNSNFTAQKIDGIAWYSPTIFWGPLVKQLKKKFNCKSYLILRDIFPDWAIDLGVLRNKVLQNYFRRVALNQFLIANKIGVQSPANLCYLVSHYFLDVSKIEVLWNWASPLNFQSNSKKVNIFPNEKKKTFIYAGNLGIAQGVEKLQTLLKVATSNPQVNFKFIGRGSEKKRLRDFCASYDLNNVVFMAEVNPDELTQLYSSCHVGLISLDAHHKTSNIPGKFVSYIRSGIPVLAIVSRENELFDLIHDESVGIAIDPSEVGELSVSNALFKLLDEEFYGVCAQNSQKVFLKYFKSDVASKKILDFFRVA